MPNELGFPYVKVAISAALTAAQVTAMVARTVDPTSATLATNSLSLASQTVALVDITDSVRSFQVAEQPNFLDRHSVADSVRVQRAGRRGWEATMQVYVNYDTGNTHDTVLKTPDGLRALWVERHTGHPLVAIVSIGGLSEQAQDVNGDLFVDVPLANAAHWRPRWK